MYIGPFESEIELLPALGPKNIFLKDEGAISEMYINITGDSTPLSQCLWE